MTEKQTMPSQMIKITNLSKDALKSGGGKSLLYYANRKHLLRVLSVWSFGESGQLGIAPGKIL